MAKLNALQQALKARTMSIADLHRVIERDHPQDAVTVVQLGRIVNGLRGPSAGLCVAIEAALGGAISAADIARLPKKPRVEASAA
ncbi:hypothetical protein [Vitreimonas flagellata]|uniref:hypothetical protein n=1 Tax=Vitreimonas flagellata TaxID=2560861 RepID=UPI0010753C27|nr:hypothetical protein [Vitreimonas flagellata]